MGPVENKPAQSRKTWQLCAGPASQTNVLLLHCTWRKNGLKVVYSSCVKRAFHSTSINWMENQQSVFFSSVVRPVAKAKISIVFDSLLVSLPKYKYSFVYKLWRSFYESSQTATSHFHRIQRSVSSCRPDVLTSCGPVAQTPKPRLKPRTLPFIWFVVLHSLACFPFPLHSIHPMPSPLPFHWLNAVDIDSDFDLDS